MTRARRNPPAGSSGFVLVGVVMLVLALTILGLSLYSLSSYEAQFLYGSLDHEQAIAHAQGGQYLVTALVSSSANGYRLSSAGLAVGTDGITYAHAWQLKPADGTHPNPWVDSLQTINWSVPLHVDVRTTAGSESFYAQAQFNPAQNGNPYKKLITTDSPITVGILAPLAPTQYQNRNGTVHLSGDVWQTVTAGTDSSWKAFVVWEEGVLDPSPAPIPQATNFATTHNPAATGTFGYTAGNPYTLTLNAGGGAPVFFGTPSPQPYNGYSDNRQFKYDYYCDKQPTTIKVSGAAVWVLPHGARFSQKVTVQSQGGENPVLVIVAGRNLGDDETYEGYPDFSDLAIWFESGLDVQDGVRVFLVTDHTCSIETPDDPGAGASFDTREGLCIVAHILKLLGPPVARNEQLDLSRDPDLDALADQLYQQGALPPVTSGVTNSFTMVPGSWRQP